MDVTVRFFAACRETTGVREAIVEVNPGSTVTELLELLVETYPGLRRHRDTLLLAVNHEFAEPGVRLRSGDEVALMPPVSGGASVRCWIQEGPIDVEALLALVHDTRAGAVVLFLGTVREEVGVGALEYEAYEQMAVKEFERLRSTAKEAMGVTEMAIVHRIGHLPAGETSVAVACSAPHRQAAFHACAWAMEELKKVAPVWKTERER